MVAALRERDHRGPVLRPNAACRSRPPAPSGAGGPACVRTRAEGLSGGNWMGIRDPGTPGPPNRPGGHTPTGIHYSGPPWGPGVSLRPASPPAGDARQVRYLVDSASSHMLVSKIKPCMSKYKLFVL